MPRGYAGAKRIKSIDPFSRTHGVVDVYAGRVRDDPISFNAAREATRVPRKLRLLMSLQRRAETGGLGAHPREADALGHVAARLPGESLDAFRRRVYAEVRKVRAAESDVKLTGVSEKRREYLERRKGNAASGGGGGGGGGGGQGSEAALAEAEAFADSFGKDVVDYDKSLIPVADARRAKKRSRAEDEDAGAARRGDSVVVFGERVEAPPRLTFKPTLSKQEAVAEQVRAALAAREKAERSAQHGEKKPKLDKRARLAARAAAAAAAARSSANARDLSEDARAKAEADAANAAAASSARRAAFAQEHEAASRIAPRGALRV